MTKTAKILSDLTKALEGDEALRAKAITMIPGEVTSWPSAQEIAECLYFDHSEDMGMGDDDGAEYLINAICQYEAV